MKVLIVDDEPILRDVMARTVKLWGYEAVTAADGEQALEVFRQIPPPRIVLLDLMMPKLNGIDACRLISQQTAGLTYIIILTALETSDVLQESIDSGAHDFLVKPVNMQALRCRLTVGSRLVEADDNARRNSALLESAAENADLGIWDFNVADGTVNIMRAPSFLFLPRLEIKLDYWLSLIHPEDLPGVKARLLTLDIGVNARYRVRDINGEWRWVQLIGRHVSHGKDGRPLRICGCILDASDRVELEIKMFESERLAAVSTLAAGVAHHFNNLNAGVNGYLEMLQRDDSLTSNQRRWVEKALNASNRMTEITEALQRFSTLRPNEELQKQPLGEIINDVLLLAGEEFANCGIVLQCTCDQAPQVVCERGAIAQTLFNLLDNARHAVSEKKNPQITLSCRTGDNMAELIIEDNGCGIAHENLSRIFSPFYTTKGEHAPAGSYMANFRGMGIGLYMARNVIRWHGGDIIVQSSLGEGSRFTITLPLPDKTAAAGNDSVNAPAPPGADLP